MTKRKGSRGGRGNRGGDHTRRDRLRRHLLALHRAGVISAGAARTADELLDGSDVYATARWPSRRTLAEQRGRAPCTITRHTAELERAGFLVVDRAKPYESPSGWTRWRTNRYRFCNPPKPSSSAVRGSSGQRVARNAMGDATSPRVTELPRTPERPPALRLFTDDHPPPPVDERAAERMAELRRHHLAGVRAPRRPRPPN